MLKESGFSPSESSELLSGDGGSLAEIQNKDTEFYFSQLTKSQNMFKKLLVSGYDPSSSHTD